MEAYYYQKMGKLQQAAYHNMLKGVQELADEIQLPQLDGESLYRVFFQMPRIEKLVRPAKTLSDFEKEKYVHDFICDNDRHTWNIVKLEDVYKRALQAAKKGKALTFHWRGGYFTRESFQELLEQIRKAGAEKNKTAILQVNWAQAIIRLHYEEAQAEEEIWMEEANEGEKE